VNTLDHKQRLRVLFDGKVQGVGFRPSVKRLADKCGVSGFITNVNDHVVMEFQGGSESVEMMLAALTDITEANDISFTKDSLDPLLVDLFLPGKDNNAFRILESGCPSEADAHTGLKRFPGDSAVCPDCLDELFTKGNRRSGYGFIACTVCGPRYSVMTSVPYDRERTHFKKFPLCQACQKEYEDSTDRRYHAQTISCPECGPRWLASPADTAGSAITISGARTSDVTLAKKAAEILNQRGILCLQGASGFHLMVNAVDSEAVKKLRDRK